LKPFLKSSAKPALLFLSLIICIATIGCKAGIEPTYKEKDLPYLLQKICKDEYGLEVIAQKTPTTIWLYIPLEKILHKDYGVKPDKYFDEAVWDKVRNILTTIGRVLISSDKTPEFFVMTASDINLGIDYSLVGSVLDLKKSYANFIPWTEANRRFVIRWKLAPEAVGDLHGEHIKPYDIQLPDFLAEQIAQRISGIFIDESIKNYFKVERSEGRFESGSFYFEYAIRQIAQPKKEIDTKKRILDVIAYCIKTYEFKDFLGVTIVDGLTQDKLDLNQTAILERRID